MISYKFNVLEALKSNGYSTYKLRKGKIMGEMTIQELRQGSLVSWKTIDTVCRLLNCQPGDILQYQQEKAGE